MFCVIGVLCGLCSCGWKGAKEVVAQADSLDQTEHVVYDDTVALGEVIRCLDNPFGRLFCSNTLGKAYYYMGRNLSSSNQIAEAAECYIEADRLQIDDPIYRGRINTNMGYICAQNNNDSLALIFYERANEDFNESGNEWRYAQSLLDRIEFNVKLHNYLVADSLLEIAQTYQFDSAYQARYYETRGLYFCEQQQYDSAFIYFQQGLDYWQSEEEKCFSYLKLTQLYLFVNEFYQALPYAQYVIQNSVNPNYLVNAYYCLMSDAKSKNDTELLSYYSHARTDAQRILLNNANKSAEAIPILKRYVVNPHPLRRIRIALYSIAILCILLVVGVVVYRRLTTTRIQKSTERITYLSAQIKEQQEELARHQKIHHYDKRLDKIRRKFPNPPNHWNDYEQLKRDIDPYLHNWLTALENLNLTNRAKVFCVFVFIYSQFSTKELANHLYITEDAVAVRKTRISKKLKITSTQLAVFLQSLSNQD